MHINIDMYVHEYIYLFTFMYKNRYIYSYICINICINIPGIKVNPDSSLFDNMYSHEAVEAVLWCCLLKKDYNEGCHKMHNHTHKCRPAKDISKRVNIQIIKETDTTEQPNNK
jgi:hypothetical protein